jgi:hypothetical protein
MMNQYSMLGVSGLKKKHNGIKREEKQVMTEENQSEVFGHALFK